MEFPSIGVSLWKFGRLGRKVEGGGGTPSEKLHSHVHTCSHVLDTLGMYTTSGGWGGGGVRLSLIAYV